MFLVLKLLVFYIWCCDGMRLGVQVMSACLVDVSVAGRVAIATRPATDTSTMPLCCKLSVGGVIKTRIDKLHFPPCSRTLTCVLRIIIASL